MNEAISTEVQRIISEFRNRVGGNAARRQYAPAKHQITSLTNLDLMDYMPNGFGHGDANEVIRAAMDAPKQVGGMVNGEGDVTKNGGSDLWKLLNPSAPQPEPQPDPSVEAVKSAIVVVEETQRNQVYKVMKFDSSLTYDRAQQRWQSAPELDYKAAASVAANFIEHGEMDMEIFTGKRGTNHVGEIIRMYSTGSITTSEDDYVNPFKSELNYILSAMKSALQRRWQLEGVITAAEAAEVFNLAEATVRQAINRGQVVGRKSGGTWLVLRTDAEAHWGKK